MPVRKPTTPSSLEAPRPLVNNGGISRPSNPPASSTTSARINTLMAPASLPATPRIRSSRVASNRPSGGVTAATESSIRRSQRPTLVASRRRGGVGGAATPPLSTGVPSGPMNTSYDPMLTPRSVLDHDSPNHNHDHRLDTFTLPLQIPLPHRINLQTYTDSLRHRNETIELAAARRTIINNMERLRSQSISIPNLKKNTKQGSVKKVMEGSSEKYLPRIFQYLNWNELLPMRRVCKKWLEAISTNPQVSDRLGIIVIKNGHWDEQLQLFNESPVLWTKFRIEANLFIDLMDSVQLQFWMKHGSVMKVLEIKNRSMSVTGLVEVLSRCPNISRFVVRWSPEMYPFNAELIKKYYGYNFYNGTFANMRELIVERSCYLNDNALLNMLKWCGGPLKSISLTYPVEEEQDPLTRLKPRWTIQPLRNYLERFGYSGNLHYLDFSWSNVSPKDLHILADIENLSNLKGIILNHCKLDDKSVTYFLIKKGARLEKLQVESVPLTDAIFGENEIQQVSVPRLKSLNISGSQGTFQHAFLQHLQSLEELKASHTSWLDYSKLMPVLKSKEKQNKLKSLDISGPIKIEGTKQIDSHMSRIWFTSLASVLSHVVRLNLSGWTQFGKNEHFRIICQLMPLIEELRLRGWTDLGDVGVTGLPADKLHGQNILIVSKEHKERVFVGSLKNLHTLDLSDSKISDASIKYGINSVPFLRKFAFENTQISDVGIDAMLTENQTIDKISFKGCNKINKKPTANKLQRKDGRIIHSGQV